MANNLPDEFHGATPIWFVGLGGEDTLVQEVCNFSVWTEVCSLVIFIKSYLERLIQTYQI